MARISPGNVRASSDDASVTAGPISGAEASTQRKQHAEDDEEEVEEEERPAGITLTATTLAQFFSPKKDVKAEPRPPSLQNDQTWDQR